MKDLCSILKITVNELLSGELINKEDYNKKIEEYMLEIYRQKEDGDRKLLKLEVIVGYYECNKCHHRYIPTYKSVNLAPHLGRTRYMKYPKCNKKSWNKKVLSRSDKND